MMYWNDLNFRLNIKYVPKTIAVFISGLYNKLLPIGVLLNVNINTQHNATIIKSTNKTAQRGAGVAAKIFMNDNRESFSNNLRFIPIKF